MLAFLIFLFWLIVFASPLVRTIWHAIQLARKVEREKITPRRWWYNGIWAAFGAFAIFVGLWILNLWTDVLWFRSLGYENRFWVVFKSHWLYFFVGFGASLLFFLANVAFVGKGFKKEEEEFKQKIRLVRKSLAITAIVFALIFGGAIQACWQTILLYQNQVPYGMKDPIFHKDLSFYLFSLPMLQVFTNFLAGIVVLTVLLVLLSNIALWGYNENDKWQEGYKERKTTLRLGSITHLSILGIFLMGVFILATKMATWNLLYSERGAVFGAGCTDVRIQIGAFLVFIVALVIAALCFVVSALARSIKTTEVSAITGFGVCFLTWLIGVLLIPGLYQKYSVGPNELSRETPYIKHNIAFTREAYGLSEKNLTSTEFDLKDDITSQSLAANKTTLDSARLWDWRVLQSTNDQRQVFRLYYDFPDVDVDRYMVGGQLTQVMLSAREMDQNRIALNAKTWQNQRLVYTHGFGACASPVNGFTAEGLPYYLVGDIPPKATDPALEIKQPRIYFGEKTTEHVYVKTKHPEFDYPSGDKNVTNTYDGPDGIVLNSWWRRFAFAHRFDGFRFLTAEEITDQSRILFNRDIATRVDTLAPFLRYDNDKYQVIADGQIWFLWDAYTDSSQFPYSEPIEINDEGDQLNYIRNSVKVVVNAYTGKVDFYVFDDKDPIIKTYERIFPGFFKPASAMPASLSSHIRYPEDLVYLQGRIYSLYHMDDPAVFYNKEDAWEIADEAAAEQNSDGEKIRNVIPYFVVMTIPGEKKAEFVQMLPFSPLTTDKSKRKANMTGWIAARCDGDHYGQLIAYTFPKGRLVNGPLLINTRINENDVISKDFTLWNQQGSKVITGNLLVIPLNDFRLIYIQPIYLQSEVSQMPEIKRVIVATNSKVAYGTTFEEALSILAGGNTTFSVAPTQIPPQAVTPSGNKTPPAPSFNQDLIKEAVDHYRRYQDLSGQGKMAEAGKELDALGQVLNRLTKK